jgi:hypothetical protein
MHRSPAGNAVTHGLSGKVHMPVHAQESIRQIEAELIQMHRPESETESHIVRELSVAYWKRQEHDRLHTLKVEQEMENADDHFVHQQQVKFQGGLLSLRQDPQFFRDILGRTYLGAIYFRQLWSQISDSLNADGSGMTLNQAWNAALSEQSPAHVQEINSQGWWIFERFLASSLCPQEQTAEWLVQSGAKESKCESLHASHHLKNAPDSGQSKLELQIRANERVTYWSGVEDRLKPGYEMAKHRFGMMSMGLGQGDKDLMNDSKLALRYWTTAQRSVEKLEGRLDTLKKGRELQRHRLLQSEIRENNRRERQNNRRYNKAGMELWEADQVQKHGPIPTAYESFKNLDLIENGYLTDSETFDQNVCKTPEIVSEPVEIDRPQHLSVQSVMTPVQNGSHPSGSVPVAFHEWPDRDFTDPMNETAYRLLAKIEDENDAISFCLEFSAEQFRRRNAMTAGRPKFQTLLEPNSEISLEAT